MISRGPTSLSRDFPGTQPAVNGSHRAGISPRPLRDAFPHPLTKEAFSRWPPLSAVRPDRYFFPSQRFLYYMHFPLICKYFFRRAFFRRGGVRFALLRLGERKLASAWGVMPGRELPSALGHNEDVFGPAFFKKLAERETASRDLIRLPKRRRGSELSRRGRLTGEPSPGVAPFFVAFFRRGIVRFALSRLGERKLASAWGVMPGRELPSALGHNEDVFGPAFFKKLAERETASRDLIRLPKRRRGSELSRRGRLTGEPSPGVPPFFRRFSSSRDRRLCPLAVGGEKVSIRVGGCR